MVKGSITKKHANLKSMADRLKALAKKEVYVGIPAEKSSRQGEGINNAELLYAQSHGVRSSEMRKEIDANTAKGMKYSKAHSLYIHSHGSALWAIPPRPVLEPAIKANKEIIGKKLAEAGKAALQGDADGAERQLELAGMLAQNKAREWFEDSRNNWPPNSPVTIKRKGSSLPLVDTGEMRKAITYVVREK